MATFHVTGPDGGTYEVNAPEDASQADIMAYVQQNAAPAAPDKTTRSDGYNLAQKFGRGVGDVVEGATQLGLHGAASIEDMLRTKTLEGLVTGDNRGPIRKAAEKYDRVNNNYEDTWQANRKVDGDTGMEVMRGVGSGVAMAPAMMAMPGLGAGLLPAIGEGALQGAAAGVLSPTYGDSNDYWSNKGEQTATSAVLGGATSGVLNRVGAALRPNVDQAVQYLRNRGVQPTIGQNLGSGAATFEDAISSINPAVSAGQRRAVEQYNVAALNEALARVPTPAGTAPITYDGPAGREGVRAVGDTLSDAFNTVKSKITLPISDPVRRDLTGIVNEASVTAPEIGARVQRFLDAKVLNRVKGGVLTGDAFKDAESALTTQARQYSKSLSGDERTYATALHDAADVLRTHLADSNPQQAATLRGLNEGWAILARIEDAVPTGSPEGIFTPFQLARAVETADSSVRHRQYVRGEALLQPLTDAGLKVLGNKYPNSGTAGRLAAAGVLGGTAMVSPGSAVALAVHALGYTPMLQNAAGALLNGQRSLGSRAAGTAIQAASPYAGALAGLIAR